MSFPCVRQHDQNDCGPAVLATVSKHYGLPLGIGRVRELVKTDAMGTNFIGLTKGAELLGYAAKAAKASYEALEKCPKPLIAHVLIEHEGLVSPGQVGHFVVVFGVGDKHVDVADPGYGLRRMARADFEEIWTGAIMLLVPTPKLAGVAKSDPSWRRFLGLLAGRWSLFVEAVIAAVIATALGLLTSFYVQHLVDDVLVHGRTRLLHLASIGMVLITIFKIGFSALENYLLTHLSQKIDVSLTMEYYQHVLRLPLSFFEARRTGEILARMQDAHKIRQAVSGTILGSVVDAMLVVVSGGVMFFYDWRLALITLSVVPAYLIIVLGHRPAIQRAQRAGMEQSANLQAHIVEVVGGAAAVKAACADRHVQQGAETRLVQMVRTSYRLAMLSLSTSSLASLVTATGTTIVFWFGGMLVIRGELSIGQLLFFSSLLAHLLDPLARLANANVELQDALIAADRVGEILDLKPEETPGAERIRPSSFAGTIRFDNVKFRYGFREWVLNGVTLEAPAGKTIALVGRSGSGKTTISKLAAGFYPPTEGRVLIDGHDLRDVDVRWYRSNIGIVDQECVVFSQSVKDNIRLGRPDATFEEVVDAAKAAGAHEFIEKLPERFETLVGERGSNLSGGQRQRLAIARAVLGNPRLLILDEATSHLDSETEKNVQRTLRELMSKRTSIVIAHRLSTILAADRIYVLDDGRVVEEGTHEELLALEGAYCDMWLEQVPASLLKDKHGRRALDLDIMRSGDLVVYLDSDEGPIPTEAERER